MNLLANFAIMLAVITVSLKAKKHGYQTSPKQNSRISSTGETCKNDGNCSPGLKCCDVIGGNKCWECCEDVHCDALGMVCW